MAPKPKQRVAKPKTPVRRRVETLFGPLPIYAAGETRPANRLSDAFNDSHKRALGESQTSANLEGHSSDEIDDELISMPKASIARSTASYKKSATVSDKGKGQAPMPAVEGASTRGTRMISTSAGGRISMYNQRFYQYSVSLTIFA